MRSRGGYILCKNDSSNTDFRHSPYPTSFHLDLGKLLRTQHLYFIDLLNCAFVRFDLFDYLITRNCLHLIAYFPLVSDLCHYRPFYHSILNLLITHDTVRFKFMAVVFREYFGY